MPLVTSMALQRKRKRRLVTCRECKGLGSVTEALLLCTSCHGTGRVYDEVKTTLEVVKEESEW